MYGWQTSGVDQTRPDVIAWKLAGSIYVFVIPEGSVSKMTSVTLMAAQNSVKPASSGDRYSNYALDTQDDVYVVQQMWDNSLTGFSTIIWNVNTNYNVKDVRVVVKFDREHVQLLWFLTAAGDFNTVEKACRDGGGHLATIHSLAENNIAVDLEFFQKRQFFWK